MFCSNCGTSLSETAAFCKNCGQKVNADDATVILQASPTDAPMQQQSWQQPQTRPIQQQNQQYWQQPQEAPSGENDTLITVTKVFFIIGCISQGWMLIPLAWCLPITISCFRKMNNRQAIGTGMKVAALLLVSLISGICMLCMKERNGRI